MRCIILCIDGLGIGKLPDAQKFDQHSLISEKIPIESLQNLKSYGLNYLVNAKINMDIEGSFGRMAIKSNGVSLRSSLWELAGKVNLSSFDPATDIQQEDLDEISKALNIELKLSGEKELLENTKQIVIKIENENKIEIASQESLGPDLENALFSELIKTFSIDEIEFINSKNKKKISRYQKLESPNLFSRLKEFGYAVQTIGTIDKFFQKEDISFIHHKDSDEEVFETLADLMDDKFDGIIFALFDDYYKKVDKRKFSLKRFDSYLPVITDSMKDDDIIFITSTTGVKEASLKRTREYIPLMVKGKFIKEDTYIGVRHSAADLAQTIVDMFGVETLNYGKSFKEIIMEG